MNHERPHRVARAETCSRVSARVAAATLAAALGRALARCSTPVLKPSVEVAGKFAAAPADQNGPEVAWWEGYGDPVLSDLVRRAAPENRDIKIAAERAGETISRSWLLPSIGASAVGLDYAFKAWLAAEPEETFDVVLRELSPQAAAQTRTYRARLKPGAVRRLPLGATATLVAEYPAAETPVASVPTGAITQSNGQPALWVVRHGGTEPIGTVDLIRVTVHGYRNDQVLVSGPPPGALIVTAGVQKMAPGLRVALSDTARSDASKQVAR